MVVHCNWLFLQGHECFPTFLLPLHLSEGTGKGKGRASLEKTFPLQNSKLGRKGTNKEIHPNYCSWGGKNAHAWEIIRVWGSQAPQMTVALGPPHLPFLMALQAGWITGSLLAGNN